MRLFASKRQALPKQAVIHENDYIRFGRNIQLASDHLAIRHLHKIFPGPVSLHEVCWKKNVRFAAYNPTTATKTSDSCILFQTCQNEVNCGFIVAFISDPNQQCHLTLHKVHVDQHDSLTLNGKHIINPFIFWGQLTDPPRLQTIHIQVIMLKIAYTTAKDIFHFYRYPNTAEIT